MGNVARREGNVVITSSSQETDERERELVTTLLSRQVEGLLLVPAARDHGYVGPELGMGMRVVFLDRPPGGLDADAVLIDNAGGARAGVEHLPAQGHHRIGLIGDPPGLYTLDERVAGYRSALEARGVTLDPKLLRLGAHESTRPTPRPGNSSRSPTLPPPCSRPTTAPASARSARSEPKTSGWLSLVSTTSSWRSCFPSR